MGIYVIGVINANIKIDNYLNNNVIYIMNTKVAPFDGTSDPARRFNRIITFDEGTSHEAQYTWYEDAVRERQKARAATAAMEELEKVEAEMLKNAEKSDDNVKVNSTRKCCTILNTDKSKLEW